MEQDAWSDRVVRMKQQTKTALNDKPPTWWMHEQCKIELPAEATAQGDLKNRPVRPNNSLWIQAERQGCVDGYPDNRLKCPNNAKKSLYPNRKDWIDLHVIRIGHLKSWSWPNLEKGKTLFFF